MARVNAAVATARAAGTLPTGVHHAFVKHDDDCRGLRTNNMLRCDCTPEIEILSASEYLKRVKGQ